MRRSHTWMAGAGVMILGAMLGARPLAGQQQGAIAASARVAPLAVAVTPEVLKGLFTPLPGHRSGAVRGPGSGSVASANHLFTMEATRECADTGVRGCRVRLTVQLLAN